MATPPIDPAAITDYHMHVYYDAESRERAGTVAGMGGGTVHGPHGPLA